MRFIVDTRLHAGPHKYGWAALHKWLNRRLEQCPAMAAEILQVDVDDPRDDGSDQVVWLNWRPALRGSTPPIKMTWGSVNQMAAGQLVAAGSASVEDVRRILSPLLNREFICDSPDGEIVGWAGLRAWLAERLRVQPDQADDLRPEPFTYRVHGEVVAAVPHYSHRTLYQALSAIPPALTLVSD